MARGAGLVVVALLVIGCQSKSERASVDSLRDDIGLPMYYAGDSFGGLELTHAESWDSPGKNAYFLYGTCDLPEGEGGCPLPISIQHHRFMRVHWGTWHGCLSRETIRGVPAGRRDGLALFTGEITIMIRARTRGEEQRVARALRSVNGKTSASSRLPPLTQKARRMAAEACQ